MKKYGIFKKAIKFFVCYLLYGFIGGIGLVYGIDAFSYNLFRDDFNLQFFFLDLIRFFIAFSIVFGIPKLLKKQKAIVEE